MPTKRRPPPTDAEVIVATGTALYGGDWPARLAADLGISKESARNVPREHANLFPDQVERLEQLLEERHQAIDDALDMISAWRAKTDRRRP